MSVDFIFGVSCATSDTGHPSSGSSSLRSNRGDNCKAPPPRDQPPYFEAPWFLASPGTPIDTASSEGTIEPTSVLNPLDCSSPTCNPATWAMSLYSNGPGSPAVDNLVDDGSPFLEKPEENDQGDLHNFPLEEGKAVLEYEDFVLYKEPDWFDDLEPQLSERPFVTPQPRNDDERMSDDEYICYFDFIANNYNFDISRPLI
ncbi:hypothetical protein FPRO05_13981 [Fusarium proliferatum]|uniref:Uncharacterized protein n=1 Tax=Gibberella intermedia TaxID=948311 RepID=A0A365MWK4_GIBIN|nr:hypothetical protein FPRO05_13981 [Fusarium proliferatum]